MSDQPTSGSASAPKFEMVIPAFGQLPQVRMDLSSTKEAESRLIEAKTVNPITYSDLEHCFNESYRELKKHMATIGFQITKAEKAVDLAKADVFLDKYPDWIAAEVAKAKEKGVKFQDSADVRDAFLARDAAYQQAMEHLSKIKAMESFMDGKIRVMENVCRYMRKQMDIVLRSGIDPNLYNTQGKR